MTQPSEAEFVALIEGTCAMREELHRPPPSKDDISAIWAWYRHRGGDDDIGHSLWENVKDGLMWADWHDGEIVFRLTPTGIAKVETAIRRGGFDKGLDA